MKTDTPKNAIIHRLDKLVDFWHDFTKMPDARICRWRIAPDELDMIEVLYETESSEYGELPDLFLKFETPFQELTTYGHTLFENLKQQVQELHDNQYDREALQEEGISLQWQPLPKNDTLPGSLVFLNNLVALAESIEDLEGVIVVYLSPKENQDLQQWIQWFVEVIELGIPPQVRIMVADVNTHPVLDELAQAYPAQIITYEPHLDMPSAMQELASQGDPADPGVQFRKAFVALTQASGKGDLPEVQRLATEALNIAEKHSWHPMKVTVHFTVGGALLGTQQYDKAFQTYGEALKVANKTFEEGELAGGKLAIQAYFSQGATMIAAKDYPAAAKGYEQAIPVAQKLSEKLAEKLGEEKIVDEKLDKEKLAEKQLQEQKILADAFNLMMEAWRMAAYCHETDKEYERAWECNNLALDAGEKLDKETRDTSTLPYVGQALERLAKKMERSDEQKEDINHRMVILIGEEWKEKIQT